MSLVVGDHARRIFPLKKESSWKKQPCALAKMEQFAGKIP